MNSRFTEVLVSAFRLALHWSSYTTHTRTRGPSENNTKQHALNKGKRDNSKRLKASNKEDDRPKGSIVKRYWKESIDTLKFAGKVSSTKSVCIESRIPTSVQNQYFLCA